jgi:hypothetical protein
LTALRSQAEELQQLASIAPYPEFRQALQHSEARLKSISRNFPCAMIYQVIAGGDPLFHAIGPHDRL